MNVYLAGKIRKNDWRHDLVKGLRNAEPGEDLSFIDTINHKDLIYSGPFFESDDHGSFHKDNSHGALNLEISSTTKTEIKMRCLKYIDNCDIFFTWIFDQRCYGTLYELGYATAKNKFTIVACSFPVKKSDLWFPVTNCNLILEKLDEDPVKAFNLALMRIKTDGKYNKILK